MHVYVSFFVNFFEVPTQLRREMTKFKVQRTCERQGDHLYRTFEKRLNDLEQSEEVQKPNAKLFGL